MFFAWAFSELRALEELDVFDLRLLAAIQAKGDMTQAELSEIVHLSPTQCARRLQRLRTDGYVRDIVAILDPERLGINIIAHTLVGLRNHDDETGKAFRAFIDAADEVVECWSQTGDADYLLKIMVKDLGELASLIERLITAVGGFASLRSFVALKAIKRTTTVPIRA